MGAPSAALMVVALARCAVAAAPQPHIVLVVIDGELRVSSLHFSSPFSFSILVSILMTDYGWNGKEWCVQQVTASVFSTPPLRASSDIGFHAKTQSNANEILTPNFDNLAAEGVLLDRHYVFRFCSPTRSALLTGRNPIHVNVLNSDLAAANTSDPVSGFAGLPRNISTLAEKLASVGYQTVQAGKVRHRYKLLMRFLFIASHACPLCCLLSHVHAPPPPPPAVAPWAWWVARAGAGTRAKTVWAMVVILSLMCGRNNSGCGGPANNHGRFMIPARLQ